MMELRSQRLRASGGGRLDGRTSLPLWKQVWFLVCLRKMHMVGSIPPEREIYMGGEVTGYRQRVHIIAMECFVFQAELQAHPVK